MRSGATVIRYWVCPALSLVLAVAMLRLMGLSLWSALLVVALLACPISMAWTVFVALRPLPYPLGPVPVTEGMTLDRLAPLYDVLCRIVGLGPGFRRRTIDLARLAPGERVLDVGCGTGVLTRLAADRVGPTGVAIGIDAAPDMIRVAREKATIEWNGARFQLGAVEDLKFENGSFDVALVSLLLHHLPPDLKHRGLREILRVLRPGGRVIVAEFDRPGTWIWRAAAMPLGRVPSLAMHLAGRTEALLYAAGFSPAIRYRHRRGPLGFWGGYKPTRESLNG